MKTNFLPFLVQVLVFATTSLGQQPPVVGVVGVLAPVEGDPDAGLKVLAMQWAKDCINNGNSSLCHACGELQGKVDLQLVLRDTSSTGSAPVAAQDILTHHPNTKAFVAVLDCGEAREVASRLQHPLVSTVIPDPRYSMNGYSHDFPHFFRTVSSIRGIAEAMATFVQTRDDCWHKVVGVVAEHCTAQGLDYELKVLLQADYDSVSYDPTTLNFSKALSFLHHESRRGRTIVIAGAAKPDSLSLVEQLQGQGLLSDRVILTSGLLEAGVNLEGGLAFMHISTGEKREAFARDWANKVGQMDLSLVRQVDPQFTLPAETDLSHLHLEETVEAIVLLAMGVKKQHDDQLLTANDAMRLVPSFSCINTDVKLDDENNPKHRDSIGIFSHFAQRPRQVASIVGRTVTVLGNADLGSQIPGCMSKEPDGVPGVLIVGIVAGLCILLVGVALLAKYCQWIPRQTDAQPLQEPPGIPPEPSTRPVLVPMETPRRDFRVAVVGGGPDGHLVVAKLAECKGLRLTWYKEPLQATASTSRILLLEESVLRDCAPRAPVELGRPSCWKNSKTVMLSELEKVLPALPPPTSLEIQECIPDYRRIADKHDLIVSATSASHVAEPSPQLSSEDCALRVHFQCPGPALPSQKTSMIITVGQPMYLLTIHPGEASEPSQANLLVRLLREEHEDLMKRFKTTRAGEDPSSLVLWTEVRDKVPLDSKLKDTVALRRITDGLRLYGCPEKPQIRCLESCQCQPCRADDFVRFQPGSLPNVPESPCVSIGNAAVRPHPCVRSGFTAQLKIALVAAQVLSSVLREGGSMRTSSKLTREEWQEALRPFSEYLRNLGMQQMSLSHCLKPLRGLPSPSQPMHPQPSTVQEPHEPQQLASSSTSRGDVAISTTPAAPQTVPAAAAHGSAPSSEPAPTPAGTDEAVHVEVQRQSDAAFEVESMWRQVCEQITDWQNDHEFRQAVQDKVNDSLDTPLRGEELVRLLGDSRPSYECCQEVKQTASRWPLELITDELPEAVLPDAPVEVGAPDQTKGPLYIPRIGRQLTNTPCRG